MKKIIPISIGALLIIIGILIYVININKPIDLISHIDLSKFILKYYPEILFKVD